MKAKVMQTEMISTSFELAVRSSQLPESVRWLSDVGMLVWIAIEGVTLHTFDLGTARHATYELPEKPGAVVATSDPSRLAIILPGRIDLWTVGGTFDRTLATWDCEEGLRGNDAACAMDGSLWFGSMPEELGTDGKPTFAGGLHHLRPGESLAETVVSGMECPNAICDTGDGIFFADTETGKTSLLKPDGSIVAQTLFDGAPGLPDGAHMDGEGALWNARWGGGVVVRSDRDGLRSIQLPVPNVTSCCLCRGDTPLLAVTAFGSDDVGGLYLAPTSFQPRLEPKLRLEQL